MHTRSGPPFFLGSQIYKLIIHRWFSLGKKIEAERPTATSGRSDDRCHIVQEIKARAASFAGVEFVHEGRKANVDAHGLARSSLVLAVGRHIWLQSPPEGVPMRYNIE